ncbi:MAG TPA: peptidylprolyl isomerase [Micromonosporaceae bacterium]
MSSLKDRQRAAARARLEREMAERLAAAQRRRRMQAVIGAVVAVLVVLGGVIWLVAATSGKKKPQPNAAASAAATAGACSWSARPNQPANPNVKDVGTPPTSGEPRSGTETMTITTNLGVIKVDLDVAHAPCTSASFAYLASKHFFDNTKCHRLTTSGLYVLQCGDPSATGTGGPSYQFNDENLPTGKRPAYPAGTVAMANSGPNTNGSQFFIVYKDTELDPNYTVFGTVTQGLDIVQKVAAAGVTPGAQGNPGDGAPKTEVKIQSLTVSAPTANGGASPSPAQS